MVGFVLPCAISRSTSSSRGLSSWIGAFTSMRARGSQRIPVRDTFKQVSLTRLGNITPGRLGIFAGSLTNQPATVQREVAVEMEKLGYGTLWCGEAMGREVFVQASIFLSATSSMVIASGIANIWARDPMSMAAGGRALAEAWPDRFILGLGVSHAPMVTARGHDYARPVTAMREYLDQMGQAPWRGPEAPLPPIVLAALGPRMVALAAERTAGAYPYFTTSGHIRQVRASGRTGGLGGEQR